MYLRLDITDCIHYNYIYYILKYSHDHSFIRLKMYHVQEDTSRQADFRIKVIIRCFMFSKIMS